MVLEGGELSAGPGKKHSHTSYIVDGAVFVLEGGQFKLLEYGYVVSTYERFVYRTTKYKVW